MVHCKDTDNFFKNKKVLITGTTGMLGHDFFIFFKNKAKKVYTLNRVNGDLTNFDFVKDFLIKTRPDIIIHCAADTNLQRCEKQQAETLLLHCGLTHCLSEVKSKFVYISSDSAVQPLNFYAKTKLLGEHVSLINNKNSLVIRTNIYGFNSSSKMSLFEWTYNNLINGQDITGYDNVFFNAIYTKQLVKAVSVLLLNDHKGIINVAGDYKISKFEFLKSVCEVFKFNNTMVKQGSAPSNKLVNRPFDTFLDVYEIKDLYGMSFNLLDGLKELKNSLEIEKK